MVCQRSLGLAKSVTEQFDAIFGSRESTGRGVQERTTCRFRSGGGPDLAHAQKAYLSGALRQMWIRDRATVRWQLWRQPQRKTSVRFSPNGRFSRSAIWKSMSSPCIPITALGAAKSNWLRPASHSAGPGSRLPHAATDAKDFRTNLGGKQNGAQGIQARHDIPGPHGPHHRRIGAGVAVAGPRQGRRAERSLHRHRRHGLRPARMLRLADQHSQHRQARQERPFVQQHAYDRALFAIALLHSDRPQSSFERDVLHHRGVDRLSRRQWRDSVRERLSVGHASAAGLRHLCDRQVASDAFRADQRRRPLRPLAARARLRALLWVPRRRHASILSRSRLRQSSGRAAENA